MLIYGVSANEHDASLAVVGDGEILFASGAERYSRQKNDGHLNESLLGEAFRIGKPDLIVWYERPFRKRSRKLWSGQYEHVLRVDGATYLRRFGLDSPVKYVGHHESHAAAGFFTSPFEQAAILVIDAIGEWDTVSAWIGEGRVLRRIWHQRYPHSLGLLYSAFTHRIGLKPNEDEYILMGMAAFGEPIYRNEILADFVAHFDPPHFMMRENVHRGIRWWHPERHDTENIAASIQAVTEDILVAMVGWLKRVSGKNNLVLGGGLALNCVANTRIAQQKLFEEIWILPNPGDGGSCLGAVAAYRREPLKWRGPYLGHDIHRPFDCDGALAALNAGEVIGLAKGRAEFGPRALGNRSLLADPRGPLTKDLVNKIKQRQPFRPFAPVILAEYADAYFQMPVRSSPYMQFVSNVRTPTAFPAITHRDNTARVQTLTYEQNPRLYQLIDRFRHDTGCPMLLNTSLNVRGQPLVNTWEDALEFSATYGVKVY